MPTPPYGRATAPWVRFCHILHSTHHSARSRRTRAVSDSTASSGRNSASSRSPALVLGCPFLSFSSTFRSRHQSLYLSSMVGYSNPEIQICKSAKDTPGATLISYRFVNYRSIPKKIIFFRDSEICTVHEGLPPVIVHARLRPTVVLPALCT